MTALFEKWPTLAPWLILLTKMTVMLAAAWTLHYLLLDHNPRWRVMLWRSVMAGLVLLPMLQVVLPAMQMEVPAPPALQIRYVAVPAVDLSDSLRWRARPYAARPDRDSSLATTAPTPLQDWARAHAIFLTAAAFLLVALCLLTKTAIQLWRVHRILRSASPAPQPIVGRLRHVADDLQCGKQVELRLTAVLVSPFLTRILRPIILLPEKMTSPDRHAELDGILAHELAHVQGNDLVWLLLARCLSCVLWFHPLVWRLASVHSRACEEVCDTVAARYVGGASAYSSMLARVALELMTDAPADGGVGMVRAATILQRVRWLRRGVLATSLARQWIVTSLVLGCLVLLTLGSLKIAYAEKSPASQAAPKAAASTTSNERKPVMTNVKREGDKVWIEGVKGWSPPDMPSSIHGAQTTIMQALGENITYEELLGASGLAFRLQVSKDGVCPSSPHSFCGWRCVANSNRMLPWKIRVLEVKQDDAPAVAEARKAVMASIDRGIPVQYGSEEDGIIVGYQKDGQEWLCLHPYHGKGGKEVFVEKKWPWGIAIFTQRKASTPTRRELAVEALRQTVAMAHTQEVEIYHLGFAAWESWLNTIATLDTADEKTRKENMIGNSWIYFNLVKGRQTAAKYLRLVAGEFSDEAATHLRKAADAYEQMATQVLTSPDKKPEDIAPGPWDLKEGQTWQAETRAEQIRRLKAALPLEREAIAEIAKALAVEGLDKEPLPAAPGPRITREDGKVLINDVPHGAAGNSYARGLETLLRYLGHEVDYDTIMGDTGQAFVLQAEEGGPIQHGAVDVGWWPLASWTVKGRLEFLSGVVGRELADRPMDGALYRKDPAEHYRRFYKDVIQSSIDRGMPVLADDITCFVTAGYDEGDPPLLGDCSMSDTKQVNRIERYPWGLIVAGQAREKMDRRQVDLEAVAHAVALRREQVWPNPAPTAGAYGSVKGRYTGQRAFQLWADCVRDTEHPGESRWHGNMLMHLGINRRSAEAWLRAAAKRHPQEVAQHLSAAADIYAGVVAQLPKAGPAIRGLATPEGRDALVQVIEYVAALEARATNEMAKALAAAGAGVKPVADADLPKLPAEPHAAPEGPRYPVPGGQATTIRTSDAKDAEWAVLQGEWSVDPAGNLVGRSGSDGYLYRIAPHADDVRVTATLRATAGDEVTVWMCGSPTEVEHEGYTLAIATSGAKLQRKGKTVQQVTAARIQPDKDHIITFERSGATLRGFLDGAASPFIEWTDSQPLRGTGHGTMGFYVYGGTISIKNVKIEALPPQPAAVASSTQGGKNKVVEIPDVNLRGNACAEDSFSKAVQAAAKILGREVDLQTIQALSTNAFAPNIRTCETCKSWWDIQAQDTAIELIAKRIGLRVESLPMIDHSADPPMPKDKEADREWLRTYYRKPLVPAIRKALDAGKVIIAGNEWDFAFHSNAWFGWGIISDAGEDGWILGAGLNGRSDDPMNYVGSAWVLSVAEPSLNAHQADLEMLRLAVDRIRGNTKAHRTDGDAKDTYLFGLDAMVAWVREMETTPGFCAECQARGGRGWSDALDNGRLMHDGALFAASCLRNRADSFPSAAHPHLEAAAKQYDRIAQMLHPAVTTNDPGYCKTFIGDLAKQKTHADQVLRPVRAALESAGDEIAAALAVEGVTAGPAKVRPVVSASQAALSVGSAKGTPPMQ